MPLNQATIRPCSISVTAEDHADVLPPRRQSNARYADLRPYPWGRTHIKWGVLDESLLSGPITSLLTDPRQILTQATRFLQVDSKLPQILIDFVRQVLQLV